VQGAQIRRKKGEKGERRKEKGKRGAVVGQSEFWPCVSKYETI